MAQAFPSKLGRYQIVKHLANGGMAQVLLARATGIENFERHVVVKRIHAERAEDPQFVKMFLDEARLAAQLHHNNIVQVHDIGKEKGEYFFAMEYVHGEDLRKLLMAVNKRQGTVPLEHVVTIVTTAAAALHHAHEQRGADRKPLGLVHRDVSPANILVGYDGNIKVVDFGIAKAALRGGDSTQVGALKGKVSYMAPEQCAGKPIDRRSDVYALGIVLYELTTVRRLFKGENDFLTMSAIVQGNIPKPTTHRPDIPVALEKIILKALALEPKERYQSADEMREALEQFAASLGLRTSTGALAGYMKQVFGVRPEPWLVEDDVAELELSADFDGSASGIAQAPEQAVERLEIPQELEVTASAPIMRARKHAITGDPPSRAIPSVIKPTTRPAAAGNAVARPLPPPKVARITPPGTPPVASGAKSPPPIASGAKTPPPELGKVAMPPSRPTPTPRPGVKTGSNAAIAANAMGGAGVGAALASAAAASAPTATSTVTALTVASAARVGAKAAATEPTNALLKPALPIDDEFSNVPDEDLPIEIANTMVPMPPVLPPTDKLPVAATWSSAEKSSTGSGTPLAWTTDDPADPALAGSALSGQKKSIAIGVGLAAVVLMVLFLITRGGGRDRGDENSPPPAAAKPSVPSVVEPGVAATPAPPPEITPEPIASGFGSAAGSDSGSAAEPDDGAGSNDGSAAGSAEGSNAGPPVVVPNRAGSGAAKKKPPIKKKPAWNPDELFLD
ncbi:MAG: protein kinase [Deltaproteobacteria bacterium]|nr:protein kinase [Deltaproteobacteria bacterium]MDQ3298324.1 protein kinase [Myxococcota bacterium]